MINAVPITVTTGNSRQRPPLFIIQIIPLRTVRGLSGGRPLPTDFSNTNFNIARPLNPCDKISLTWQSSTFNLFYQSFTFVLLYLILPTNPKENFYGTSIISLNEKYRARMEPGATPYDERIASLRALHDASCKTWISMEPYPAPNQIEQSLTEILETINFADKIIFGRTIQ